MQQRIGTGFDVHQLQSGRALILGGIKIDFEKGLLGHSDADVLLHAITDAVLGALAWGDIGQWFPNNDQKFAGADSKELFRLVWKKVTADGWTLVNTDSTLICEAPKLAPHVPAMRRAIAELFGADIDRVSVKATTNEGLGYVGRGEGIAAQAAVLLQKS